MGDEGFLDDALDEDDEEEQDVKDQAQITEVEDTEPTELSLDTAETATPAPENSLVRPVANIDEVVKMYDQFEDIKEKLLDKTSDLTNIQGNPHVNKSGWRKIATAFNVSIELVESQVWVDDGIVKAKALARATASNGKTATAGGMCASNESNHMVKLEDHPNKSDPEDDDVYRIDGKWRVLKPPEAVNEHNIVSIAETRAKNRAISDLVGGGEVSAEEMGSEFLDV